MQVSKTTYTQPTEATNVQPDQAACIHSLLRQNIQAFWGNLITACSRNYAEPAQATFETAFGA